MDYVDLVVNFVAKSQPRAHQVLLKLLEQYEAESKSRFTHHKHVLLVLSLKNKLVDLTDNATIDARMGEVFTSLNEIPLLQLNSSGHFASLLQVFFGVYPHYLAKLNPTLVEHIKIKPYLLAAEADVDIAKSILMSHRQHNLEITAVETLTDLMPVAAVREQIKINDILIKTTNISSLVKLLQTAPEKFKPEIIERLITIVNNTSSQSQATVLNLSPITLGKIIEEISKHVSFMSLDLKNTAAVVLLQIFSKQDKTLSLITADTLQKIVATLPVQKQADIGLGLQSMVGQYSQTPGSLEPYTVIIIILKFFNILTVKMLNTNLLIHLYMTNGVLFQNELSIISYIPKMIAELTPDEKVSILSTLAKNLTSSNPKIESQLIILAECYSLLPSSYKVSLLQCFFQQFAEYKRLSTEDGIADLCNIYKSVLVHDTKSTADNEILHLQTEIQSTLTVLLNKSRHIETAMALMNILLMMKSHATENKRTVEINYLISIIQNKQSSTFMKIAICNLLGAYPDIKTDEIANIVTAISECINCESIQLKLAALIAFTTVADKITADPDELIYTLLAKNLSHTEVLVKAQTCRALAKISRFIPELDRDALINNLINQTKKNVTIELAQALYDSLGDFAPDIKENSDTIDTPKKKLLENIFYMLTNSYDETGASGVALLIKLAPTFSDTLMNVTIERLNILSQHSILKIRILAMQVLNGFLPLCKTGVKDKLAIDLQWGLCDRNQALVTEAGLKSITLSNNMIETQLRFILSHLFLEKNSQCSAALQKVLLHSTKDCPAVSMLIVIKKLFVAIESDEPHTRAMARSLLLGLANNIMVKPKYEELKSFFICEYLLAQRSKTIMRETYFTFVSIVATFATAYVKKPKHLENIPLRIAI